MCYHCVNSRKLRNVVHICMIVQCVYNINNWNIVSICNLCRNIYLYDANIHLIFFFIKRLIVATLYIFIMSEKYFLFKMTFAHFNQITRIIFKFECIDAFCRTMCFIVVCWFCVLIDVILISWIIISKIRHDKNVVETTFLNNVLFYFNFCFVFVDRVKIFMFLLNKRLIINTFFLCFSTRIILFINFLMNNVLMFTFSIFFLILYISILFFLSSFNCFCWFKLMNFVNSIVVAFFSSLLFVFIVAAYDSIVVVILLMFCIMFINLLFISLNFTFIVLFTINVDNNTTTQRNNDNCKFDSIMFTILSRSKICISFFI
jgi:hypothetical protein